MHLNLVSERSQFESELLAAPDSNWVATGVCVLWQVYLASDAACF